MKMPPPFSPVWNLRIFRAVALAAFVATLLVVAFCLISANFMGAGAVAFSAAIFGLNWNSVRNVTSLLEKWAQRPGFQKKKPEQRM